MDFSTMNEEELMSYFNSEQWGQLTNDQKIELLTATELMYCEQNGITDPPTVRAMTADEIDDYPGVVYGYYSDSSNLIAINVDAYTNPYKALETIAHECNHCYQHQAVDGNDPMHKYNPEELLIMKANFEEYLNTATDGVTFSEYYSQSVEVDSRIVAANYVMDMCEKYDFTNDPMYASYLRTTQSNLEDTQEAVENDGERVEDNQIDGTYHGLWGVIVDKIIDSDMWHNEIKDNDLPNVIDRIEEQRDMLEAEKETQSTSTVDEKNSDSKIIPIDGKEMQGVRRERVSQSLDAFKEKYASVEAVLNQQANKAVQQANKNEQSNNAAKHSKMK